MKCIVNIFLLVLLFDIVNGQEWTEPVVINPLQSQFGSAYPDFCIDNEGNIHCVWSTMHGTNFYRIYYSKSTDNGETWSNPVSVSMNSSQWMSEPHIVSDIEGKLHLTYDGNVGSYPNKTIIYKFYDGNAWSAPDTLNKGYVGAMHNRLVIDSNDRLYCFWYIDSGYGKMYYRFMDVGFIGWSDVIMPYDTAFFYKIRVGLDNSLNIIGATKSPSEIKRRFVFYKYYDTFWTKPETVSPQTNISFSDISLDLQLNTHIVWSQYSIGNGTGIDSSMYRYKNDDGWQSMEFIHSDIDDASIIVDNVENIHIIEVENVNDSDLLTEYQKSNEQWEASIIEENIGFANIRLLCKNGFIYMVYGRKDTNDDINIMFRKKEVLFTAICSTKETKQSLKIYPNPATKDITCSFTSAENEYLKSKIFNPEGNEIGYLYNGEKPAGEIKFSWDGKDSNGEPVGRGIYIIGIETETTRITKKVIIH